MSVIAVNTRLLLPGKLDGLGWFTNETIKRITKSHPEHQFVFFFDRKFSDEFIFSDNVIPYVIPPQARHPLLWYLWFEHSVSYALKKCKADVFVSPEGLLCTRTKIPQVSVIHDLNFEHYPQFLPANVAAYYKKWMRRSAQIAKHLGTVSEFSKHDLMKTYDLPDSKIDVVYNGANEMYKPVGDKIKEEVKSEFTNACDYFLFVGSLHPRKNVINMLCAFDKFKAETGSTVKFLVVGKKQWWNNEIQSTFEKLQFKDEIIFTGRLDAPMLSKVTASALAMVYVSLFEGFGIPVIEAMSCNTPVITSNITSMPEVAGNAAMLVNPVDVNEITAAMKKIFSDTTFRNNLVEKGIAQHKNFSWDKTANCLWQIIEKAL